MAQFTLASLYVYTPLQHLINNEKAETLVCICWQQRQTLNQAESGGTTVSDVSRLIGICSFRESSHRHVS